MSKIAKSVVILFLYVWEILFCPLLMAFSLLSRFVARRFDVGLGPEPLINNIYHKKAMALYGYRSETFVTNVYFISNQFDKKFIFPKPIMRFVALNVLFVDFFHVLVSYKILYLYFNGGPLTRSRILWRIEPFFFFLAGIQTVVMPYGSDIQLLDKTQNLLFKHSMSLDYPLHRMNYNVMSRRLVLWTNYASHVISGCDWVDYMYHWDTLMVAHFSIDTGVYDKYKPKSVDNKILTILHAPNHRAIKGTDYIINAVEEIRAEGFEINLILLERKSNLEILEMIQKVDLIIDQLVIGWYAMFAIEAMLANKPVICYLRDDLLNFYRQAGLISSDEPPLINSSPLSLKNDLRDILNDRSILKKYSSRGFDYVSRVHSLQSVGKVFDNINKSLNVYPKV